MFRATITNAAGEITSRWTNESLGAIASQLGSDMQDLPGGMALVYDTLPTGMKRIRLMENGPFDQSALYTGTIVRIPANV